MDVGSELRGARERCGFSLDELSFRTKITRPILRAIENNDVAHLPAGTIFTRGFVKAYAREVGMDPIDTCDRYVAQFVPPAPEPETNVAPPPPPPPARWYENNSQGTRFEQLGTLALIVALAIGYFALTRSRDASVNEGAGAGEVVQAVDRAPAGDAGTKRAEVATTGSSDTARNARLRVDLQPRAACWISVTADGKRVAYRIMQPGERQTIEAEDELVLRVGDPANVDYAINGSPGRALGRPGQPTTVKVTRTNYRTFVRQ